VLASSINMTIPEIHPTAELDFQNTMPQKIAAMTANADLTKRSRRVLSMKLWALRRTSAIDSGVIPVSWFRQMLLGSCPGGCIVMAFLSDEIGG
jgi:hypothetical protein